MVRQVWLEWRYSRKSKSMYAELIFLLLFCMIFLNWVTCYIVFILGSMPAISGRRQKDMPEVICFLPMEREAKQRYILDKSLMLSGFRGIFMLVLLMVIGLRDRKIGTPLFWILVLSLVLDVFFYTAEQNMIKENVGYRQVGFSLYRELCCPKWYRVIQKLSWVLRVGLCITGVVFSDVSKDMPWNISMVTGCVVVELVITAVLVFIHIFLIRHDLAVLDMGDYKRKADEEGAVRYEH